MSKIIISDKNINLDNISSNFEITIDEKNIISKINVDVLNTDRLDIEYNITDERKINFNINIKKNVELLLVDKKIGTNIKSKYQYVLDENAKLVVNKINDCINNKEYDLANLNGMNANIKYVLKTISKTSETYDINVNHNANNTVSDVYTSGINIDDGVLIFNITGTVPKGKIGSVVNQNNRIINFTKNKCQINPNLLIDEMNSEANHSAHISALDEDDLFYLGLRGISKNEATKLLIKGYLMSDICESENNYIIDLTKKYWR